jgi:DNA-3-methyladenine glycosylase I
MAKIERLLAGPLRCLVFWFIDPRRQRELIRLALSALAEAGIAPAGMTVVAADRVGKRRHLSAITGQMQVKKEAKSPGARKRVGVRAPVRCAWAASGTLDTAYHDEEWGVPQHDDQRLFEFLMLEGAQAGLSWSLILKRRDGYRHAFAQFDPRRVARFDAQRVAKLMENADIVRNRLKIESAVRNARAFLQIQESFGSFDAYLWRFVDGKPIQNGWRSREQVPARTAVSDALSKDLRQRGFNFVGSTICYAYMQAIGMVNDHVMGCFRRLPVQRLSTRKA